MTHPFRFSAAVLVAGALLAPAVQAVEGNIKKDMLDCMQASKFYIAKFSVYQEDPSKDIKEQSKALCQDIPLASAAHINFDLLDRDVRKLPASIKVINPATGKVLADTPRKVAATGIVRADVIFADPGEYEAILSIGDEKSDIPPDVSAIHVPLRVAMEKPMALPGGKIVEYVLMGLGGLVGFGLLYFLYRKLRPKLQPFLDDVKEVLRQL